MKTRAELYGHEAVGLLRDITMYRVLEKEQLLRLYPGKRGKIENLLVQNVDALVVLPQEPGPLTGICSSAAK